MAAVLVLLGLGAPEVWAAGQPSVGEGIYLQGALGSGRTLQSVREAGNVHTQGADAACVNCHHRSGLGSTEGRINIPPITGRYLFHSRKAQFGEAELPYVESARANRDPYTDDTLARAIRQGVDSDGNPLGYLMPRFALSDPDMAGLIAYLKTLDARVIPGVSDMVLDFATIIAPNVDAAKRRGMLDVLARFFADKNAFPFGPSPPMRASGKTLYSKSMYRSNRRWRLHVWELTGASPTWTKQLERHLADEPVLAVVSGLGSGNWAPVHEFCEHQHLPCLFPNVEVPVVANHDFYSLYFSRGVLLEADLIAKRIGEPGEGPPVRVVHQIYRADDSGAAAAKTLAADLKDYGIAVHDHVLAPATAATPGMAGTPGTGGTSRTPRKADAGRQLADALDEASMADALVLWLRPTDIAALGEAPAKASAVFMSGLMGGLESSPLPATWRGRTRLAYPFDLPDHSRVRLEYPLQWFSIRRIPLVAEQVQVDTYLACGLLSETLNHMADTFARDYLVERTEEMLEHRLLTGPYPRLTLAEGQRFASKGGYMVQFSGAEGTQLKADRDWTIP